MFEEKDQFVIKYIKSFLKGAFVGVSFLPTYALWHFTQNTNEFQYEKLYDSTNRGWYSFKALKVGYQISLPLAAYGGTLFFGYTFLMDILRHHGHAKRPLYIDELITIPILMSLFMGSRWGVKAGQLGIMFGLLSVPLITAL